MKSRLLVLNLSFALLTLTSLGQIDDGKLWSSFTVKHKLSRKATVALTEELRLNQDITQVDQIFTDVGVEYEFFKNFKTAFNYRFINNNKFTYYEKDHRIYLDASYKYKVKKFSFALRERLQDEYSAIYSSETGGVPTWYLRSKFTIEYNPHSKYKPYAAIESFYLIDHPKEKSEQIDRLRYLIGVEYEFNRKNFINLFTILQEQVSPQNQSVIVGVGYTYVY